MSELELSYSGYVCAPYLHNHESVELKDAWMKSKNIEAIYFVTGTFSSESKPYFSDSTNHCILAKFKDSEHISKDLTVHNQEKTSFIFNIKDDLFQREVKGDTNFVSVYYLEYGDDGDDLQVTAKNFACGVETAILHHCVRTCEIPSPDLHPRVNGQHRRTYQELYARGK